MTDSRLIPQIPTEKILLSAFSMFLGRIGSLNGLEQTKNHPIWKTLLGGSLPSADTIGRVVAKMDTNSLRQANKTLYSNLKRKKSLVPPAHGLVALLIDGHETSCSAKKHCAKCKKRKLRNGTIQYYHKNVTAQLVFESFCILLDAEPIKPKEGELTAAKRLFKRILKNYPRAFDVVVLDALYTNHPIFKMILQAGKDFVSVFKSNAGDVYKQAKHILDQKPVQEVLKEKNVKKEIKETSEVAFGAGADLRVIESQETKVSKSGVIETAKWLWVTSLKQIRCKTKDVVKFGHDRWKIENKGFNESVNHWFSDHVYRHDEDAILNFWLICMMAMNVFMCFFYRNLKIEKSKTSMLYIAKLIQSQIYDLRSQLFLNTRSP